MYIICLSNQNNDVTGVGAYSRQDSTHNTVDNLTETSDTTMNERVYIELERCEDYILPARKTIKMAIFPEIFYIDIN